MLERSTESPPVSSWRIRLPQFTWLHTFVLLQFLLQIALLFPEISRARIVLRVATFVLSLGLLWKAPKTGCKHPAQPWALAVLGIMALELFWHPYHSSTLAAIAQCVMYLAVLAPLFWVSRLEISDRNFRGLIYLLWGFHTLSSIVGVLQVYNPELFQFTVSSIVEGNQHQGANLKITLANGLYIYRPSGLSDVPGSAAMSGFYALLFGMGMALQERNPIVRLLSVLSVPIGLFCIFLSQVRSLLILSLVCLLVIALVLIQLRRFWQAGIMLGGGAIISSFTMRWASAIGGEELVDRFAKLISDSPDKVFYQNRGVFLEHTVIELLPQYPFGAGLGRWGMINNYFGNHFNPLTQPIWAEIQWTGWVLDGGIPLVIAYSGAIVAACFGVWQVIHHQHSPMQLWGIIIFAYNIGAIVITFNYPLFIGQGGMEFWLLNAALLVAARSSHRIHATALGL